MNITKAINLKKVLKDTKRILKHHNDMAIAKGEHFNLFSVLSIETRENKTHSAFLSELLNPKGSHLLGNVFLKLFLQVVNPDKNTYPQENSAIFQNFINPANTFVRTEFTIGKRNDEEKEGGRIDIYIKNGINTICIENKIYAHDQNTQIERYCNYNKAHNTVFYLTLFGENPSDFSKGELEANDAFYNISYSKDIVTWLELCLKEVPNFPGLRESINQYILLIKKLTHTLSKQEQQELSEVMIEHLEESKYIVNNYQALINSIREGFRTDLKNRLETQLNSEHYNVIYGLPINQKYSQLWIEFKDKTNHPFKYGIEAFSAQGHNNGQMFVGIFGSNPLPINTSSNLDKLSNFWQHVHWLTTTQGNNLHLDSTDLLKILYNQNSEKYKALINTVSNQIIKFIKDTETQLQNVELNNQIN